MSFETVERAQSKYEEAFQNPETIEVDGGTLEVADIRPDQLKTEIPLIVEPGWLANIPTWKKNAVELANLGRRVIIVAAPHGVTPSREDPSLPMAELRKAEAFLPLVNAKGIEKADVLTHSEGGVFMTAAALANPERVRTILYDAPVGLIGSDNFWKLAPRFLKDAAKEAWEIKWKGKGGDERRQQADAGFMAGLKVLVRTPVQSMKEAAAMATVQVHENFRELRKKGVKVIVMHPVGDSVSPIERMAGKVVYDEQGNPQIESGKVQVKNSIVKADMVDGFLSVGDPSQTGEISDTHNSLYLSPRQFSAAIDVVLDTVERNLQHRVS